MLNLIQYLVTLAAYNIPDSLKNASANFLSNFNFNQPSGKGVIQFYEIWKKSGYLYYHKVFWIQLVNGIKGALLIFFYNIAHGMEQIFDATLNSLLIFNDLGGDSFGPIRKTIIALGFGMLILSLTWLAISAMTGKGEKYIKGLKSAVQFTAIVILLPLLVSSLGQITKSGADAISHSGSPSSMALQPIQDNVIDVLDLANNEFDVNPNKLQANKYNDFTDDNIGSVAFGEIISKENIKKVDAKKNPGGSKVFNYVQSDNDLTEHSLPKNNDSGITNAFSGAYARYTGQYFIAILTEGVLALVLLVMAFRVVKSVYQILVTTLAAPLVFYSNLQKPSRIKELLSALSGSMISIWTELISIQVFFIIISDLNGNPATKALIAMNGGPLQIGILKLIIMIGSFTGFLFGIQLVERWTGVPSGSGHGIVGLALGGAMAAKGASGAVNAAKSVGGTAKTAAGMAKSGANKFSNGIHSLDDDSMKAQASRSKNPASGVGSGSKDSNKSNGSGSSNSSSSTNSGSKSNAINSNNSGLKGNNAGSSGNKTNSPTTSKNNSGINGKGSSETSGSQLNDNKNPAANVGSVGNSTGDNNGTNEGSEGFKDEDNGLNPASGVGESTEGQSGTNESSDGFNDEDNGLDPASGVGESTEEQSGTNESSDGFNDENNGFDPTSGIDESTEKSSGTNEGSDGFNDEDNGLNPAYGVGDSSEEQSGTSESSDGFDDEDNGLNPTSGVGDSTEDSPGTSENSDGFNDGAHGLNPASNVKTSSTDKPGINNNYHKSNGDSGQLNDTVKNNNHTVSGTGTKLLGNNPSSNVKNPASNASSTQNNNGISSNSQIGSVGKNIGDKAINNPSNAVNRSNNSGPSSDNISDGLNDKVDSLGSNNEASSKNYNRGNEVVGNNELSAKLDQLGEQQKQQAKANKPKFADKLQDTANSLSRIQQETDNPSLNPPQDNDDF